MWTQTVRVDSVWQSQPHTNWWTCVCVCAGGDMVNVSWWPFDRVITSWKMGFEQPLTAGSSPSSRSIQLCCLSGRTSPSPLSLWSCQLSRRSPDLFFHGLLQFLSNSFSRLLSLMLLQDPERSHRPDLDGLNFTRLRGKFSEELRSKLQIQELLYTFRFE